MTDRDRSGEVGVVQRDGPQLRVLSQAPTTTEIDFDDLFVAHFAFVRRALGTMGVDTATTEDLAQDVFLVLHRRLGEYDPSRDVRGFLWGIAKRVAATHARTRSRADRKLRALPTPDSPAMPDAAVSAREEARFVADALAAMPESQREVFVLTEIESMSAPEISEALGIKLNTVYSRLKKGRARFQKAVERRRKQEARR